MPFKPTNLKGTRDFSPIQMAQRNYMKNIISRSFGQFGFQPIETPSFERREFLEGLYGEEAETLIFKILNSGHKVHKADIKAFGEGNFSKFISSISEKALRYDLTIPLSRYVAQHRNQITFPFRRYQIQPVWRADRPQYGRLQEFVQCDADIIGPKSILNEIDMLLLMGMIFNRLGVKKLTAKINHRLVLEELINSIGALPLFDQIAIHLDKIDKIGISQVMTKLSAIGLDKVQLRKIEHFVESPDELANLSNCSSIVDNALKELKHIKSQYEKLTTSIDLKIIIDPQLARGLNYYTGMVTEVISDDFDSIGSIAAGGRYDNLTAKFGLSNVSGMGISLGFDRIQLLMEQQGIFPKDISQNTQILMLNFGNPYIDLVQVWAQNLRSKGKSVEVYPSQAKLSKQLTYANNLQIGTVILYGPDEEKKKEVVVRYMKSRNQVSIGIDELITHIESER